MAAVADIRILVADTALFLGVTFWLERMKEAGWIMASGFAAYPICTHLQLPSSVSMATNQWYWSLTVPFPAEASHQI